MLAEEKKKKQKQKAPQKEVGIVPMPLG